MSKNFSIISIVLYYKQNIILWSCNQCLQVTFAFLPIPPYHLYIRDIWHYYGKLQKSRRRLFCTIVEVHPILYCEFSLIILAVWMSAAEQGADCAAGAVFSCVISNTIHWCPQPGTVPVPVPVPVPGPVQSALLCPQHSAPRCPPQVHSPHVVLRGQGTGGTFNPRQFSVI